MRIVAVANSKGGSGKSTTTYNLAHELARNGNRVLLWDMDPQSTLTNFFKVDFNQDQLYSEDILSTEKLDPSKAPVEVEEGLSLIPATEALGGLEGMLARSQEDLLRLRNRIEKLRHLKFDYLLLDPPGSKDIFMASTLAATEFLLIPVRPTDADFSGLRDFEEAVTQMKNVNPNLQVKGILFSQVVTTSKNQRIYRDFLKDHPWGEHVLDCQIRMSTAVANSPATGRDVMRFDPRSKAAEDYRKLAKEVLSWR